MIKTYRFKEFFKQRISFRELFLLLLGAAMYAMAMPGKYMSFGSLAYIALTPLFFYLGNDPDQRGSALKGLIFGTLASFLLLHWVKFTVSEYGNLGDLIGYIAALLLSVYCGMYFSLFAFLLGTMVKQYGRRALVAAPFLWGGIEIARTHLQVGFPWLLFGYSQYDDFYARQFASFGGVIGIGMVLVLVNILLSFSLLHLIRKNRRSSFVCAISGMCALALLHLPGYLTTGGGDGRGGLKETALVAAVQPNIDQWKKWDDAYQRETLEIIKNITRGRAGERVDLVVWPETALPFFYYWEKAPTEEIRDFVKEVGTRVITGVPWYEADEGGKYYNSIVMISPSGKVSGRYDKLKLVPFGEYVPFRKVLFFIEKLTVGAEDFSRGDGVKLLSWEGVEVVPSVCYEAIFPQLSVEGVRKGGTLLLNVTNDAWFGDSPAPYQHLFMAAFRSVETGRWMVRCANSGITAFIDRFGNIVKRKPLFTRGELTGTIGLFSGMTFYVKNAKYIHLFIIVASIILIVGILFGRFIHGRNL